MTDLHARLHAQLLVELGRPYEIWAPGNVVTPIARQRAALLAVVELHAPTRFLRRPLTTPFCETCSTDDDLHDVPWPCSTVLTIAQHLGINHGDHHA